jgi:hypothetical protein
MEQGGAGAGAESPEQARPLRVWVKDRAVGILALALVAAGQGTILLAYLFAPPDNPDTLGLEHLSHWTADVADWWLRLTAIAVGVALLGLVMDKKRDIAGAALAAAFVGFIWPWGL